MPFEVRTLAEWEAAGVPGMLSVVIPAHNEEGHITETVRGLADALRAAGISYEMLVVNDNSSDATERILASLTTAEIGLRYVNNPTPNGFGLAVRRGLAEFRGDAVAIVMADGSDDPADLVAFYRKLEDGYDCVFGSRFIKGSKVNHYPKLKLVVNRIVNHCIQIMFWTRFNDLTNAFKAYRTEVIRECGPYHASHFNITLELSLGALVRKYNIVQVPISWSGRTWGSSNLRIGEMGRRYLSTLLMMFFARYLIADDMIAERLASRNRRSRYFDDLDRRVKAIERHLGIAAEPVIRADPISRLSEPADASQWGDAQG